jgi:hypothetical protein
MKKGERKSYFYIRRGAEISRNKSTVRNIPTSMRVYKIHSENKNRAKPANPKQAEPPKKWKLDTAPMGRATVCAHVTGLQCSLAWAAKSLSLWYSMP